MTHGIANETHAAHHKKDTQGRACKGERYAAQGGTRHKLIVKKGSKNSDHAQTLTKPYDD
jgi:hypothetical protein